MIIFDKADLKSQAGMEKAFRDYFRWMREECDGTYNAMLNPRFISCDYNKKSVLIAMDTQNWMTNPSQIVHGGVTASILDFAMGLLARCSTTGYMTPTVSMDVSYLRPVPLEKTVFVEAQITMAGFSVCHVTAKVWVEGAEDKPVATSTGVYYVTRRPD